MPRQNSQSFYSVTEEDLLVRHIAAHGERYRDYIDWCNTHDIPEHRRLKETSFPRWVQRRRMMVKNIREQARQEIIKTSNFPRAKRIQELEGTIERLNDMLEMEQLTASDLIRIEEQRRKTLEQIAKERGEWLKPPEDDEDKDPIDATKQMFIKFFESERQAAVAAKDVTPVGTFALQAGEEDI